MNDFNLKKFLIENKITRNSQLLSENSLRQDIEDFIDSVESDNYQRSKDNDPDFEQVEPTVEFFLDLYPKYKGKEDEIRQFLK
jgi:hypothetical protein